MSGVAAPLLAVDAPSLLYRAFFALPKSIKGADGRPVNALLGTANLLLQAVDAHGPRAVVLCFGAEAGAYRVAAFPGYHADRPPMPDELEHQWSDARAFFGAFGWTSLDAEPEGLEADDLLGALARVETAAGGRTLLFTGDRDMFQCVDEHVRVLFPREGRAGRRSTPAEVRERYGIEPGAGAGPHRAARRPVGRAARREGHRREGRGRPARGASATSRACSRRPADPTSDDDAAHARRAHGRPGPAARVPRDRDAAADRGRSVPPTGRSTRAAAAAAALARGMGALAGRLESR